MCFMQQAAGGTGIQIACVRMGALRTQPAGTEFSLSLLSVAHCATRTCTLTKPRRALRDVLPLLPRPTLRTPPPPPSQPANAC